MSKLFIHPLSKKLLEALEVAVPHCVILSGSRGVGLKTLAINFAKKYDTSAIVVSPDDKGSIKIDTVRQFYKLTSTKKSSFQIVIIDDADTMTLSAQNSLLKLLEEPTDKTVFLLTSHHSHLLLPTVRSRAHEVIILPIGPTETTSFLDANSVNDTTARAQLLFMATGLPAELYRLIHNQEYFNLRSHAMRQAREFISSSTYQKLVIVSKIATDRNKALDLLQNSMLILHSSLRQKPNRDTAILLKNFIQCHEKLQAAGNIRAQMLSSVLNPSTS